MCETRRKIDPTYTNPLEDADEGCRHAWKRWDGPGGGLGGYQCSKCGISKDKFGVTNVPTLRQPTPTPSITVGTQVRLTGVVSEVDSAATAKHIGVKFGNSEDEPLLWFSSGEVEVIRQPFKRGEVVYNRDESEPEPFVVLNDESLGMVDVACCRTGFHIANDNPEAYERRP